MGGSGGHMRHPHDLDEVKTGQDVIDLFRAIPNYLRSEEFESGTSSSIKLDGSNNAIKVVDHTGNDGKKDIQFAIDRASLNPLDVGGVTIDKLEQRFTRTIKKTGEIKVNTGMIRSSSGLINMMEKTYRSNPTQVYELLQRLGLVDSDGNPDPTKFINIEYIERNIEDIERYIKDYKKKHGREPEIKKGRANAIYYSFDSITFLNISQYYEVIRKGALKRPGAQRPEIDDYDNAGNKIKRTSTDVSTPAPFNREDLDALAELAAPFAPENSYGEHFVVQGPGSLGVKIDHDAAEESSEDEVKAATAKAIDLLEKNINAALNNSLIIKINDRIQEERTLETWLETVQNFPYKPYINIFKKDPAGSIIRDKEENPVYISISPFAKVLHEMLVIEQEALSKIMPLGPDENCPLGGNLTDCKKVLYGAIFYEAARVLGNTVKKSLHAKDDRFGSAVDNEGIVINAGMPFGNKVTSNTFKLTGEFIVDGSQGVYAVRESEAYRTEKWIERNVRTLLENKLGNNFSDNTYKKLTDALMYAVIEGMPRENIEIANVINTISEESSKAFVYEFLNSYDAIRSIFEEIEAAPPTSFRENLNEEEEDRMTVALLPGSFRPPTKGHYGMVQHYLSDPSVDEVVVYVSSPKEEKRTIAGRSIDPIQIWNQYVSGLENVHILKSDSPSPVTAVYEFISEAAPQNAVVILGCSEKGADPSRFQSYEKYKREDVDVESISCPVIRHDPKYINLLSSNEEILQNMPSFVGSDKSIEDIHASDMRYLAELASDNDVAKELLGYFIPENINKENIFSLLGVGKESVQEKKTNMSLLSSLVEQVLDEKVSKKRQRINKKTQYYIKKGMDADQAYAIANSMEDRDELKKGGKHSVEEELDEMSSMAGGSVAGYAGKPPRKKKNKKNEGMVEQIIDYLLNTNKLEIS